jgi:uncharacterized protein (DUF736 family)
MAYEIKDNTFSLFENDKKGNDKAPDYKGKGKVSGVEVKIAVWKRTSQSGVEYWSGSIEEVAQPDMPQAEPEKAEPQPEAVADEIPF